MASFLDCLHSNGIATIENSWDADAALIWSVLWHGRMQANRLVYEYYRSKGRPVIIIDIGTLIRGKTWKLSVNNITADGQYGHTENLNRNRPKKLGLTLLTNTTFPSILIASQHRNSQQVVNLKGTEDWINSQIINLRKVSDRPIVVRPHPRSPINTKLLPTTIQIETPAVIPNTYDSFNMNFNWHAIVNYNSGPGVQAAIAGVRPIVDRSSLAYPVSITFDDLEKPYEIDRGQWLIELSHTEYTLEELQKKACLKRIARFL